MANVMKCNVTMSLMQNKTYKCRKKEEVGGNIFWGSCGELLGSAVQKMNYFNYLHLHLRLFSANVMPY